MEEEEEKEASKERKGAFLHQSVGRAFSERRERGRAKETSESIAKRPVSGTLFGLAVHSAIVVGLLLYSVEQPILLSSSCCWCWWCGLVARPRGVKCQLGFPSEEKEKEKKRFLAATTNIQYSRGTKVLLLPSYFGYRQKKKVIMEEV